MRRRRFGQALGATISLASAAPVRGQSAGKLHRIGWLSNTPLSDPDSRNYWDRFRLELQRLGWIEGRSVAFELRFADGVVERFPGLARGLIEGGVDLIVASGQAAALAVREASSSIPAVFLTVEDPVTAGLVTSLARPGGNLTGLSSMSGELSGKRLELLQDAFPGVARIGYLPTPRISANEETARFAAARGLTLLTIEVERPDDLAGAIAGGGDADAWLVGDSPIYLARRRELVALLNARRQPAIYFNSVFVRVGGLMSYGVDFFAQSRRAAWFADRILKGAKPGDLPVEQPSIFELAVNLRTAKTIGLIIPQSVLLRADEVIE